MKKSNFFDFLKRADDGGNAVNRKSEEHFGAAN